MGSVAENRGNGRRQDRFILLEGGKATGRGLEAQLAALVSFPITVEVTDNLHTMLSCSRRDGGLVVRLHHMFLAAPLEVVVALARYLETGHPHASSRLDRFIDDNRQKIRQVPAEVRRRRTRLRTLGEVHDLEAIVRSLGEVYFSEPPDCAITWGVARRVRLPRASIRLGSYSAELKLIRIHPSLDQPHVPRWFVGWIVFHEMLHHHHGVAPRGGGQRSHSSLFMADERRYIHYADAKRWERENLGALLSWSPREGASL